ncbi:carboxypeptidase M32 [Limimaricola sp. G21655-S1]|uniref:carboxypeptidase M32 n=1 Tax=Limimaricola sp. G21655-S1 TaxID=3014768 RepID=UPI0022AE6088|nr:carboxypeptidase M32 [Limimaricola sp. G21655-S1]MCZ4260158.1 carboxypeptidase M32 [Limimaricola sp. G21655-S1]
MTAYDELMAHARETEALAQVAGRLGWDQETVMPRGAAAQRGEESAAMEGVLHARRTDPRIGDWLAAAQATDAVAEANLREVRRAYERANKVPAKLAAEIARVTSVAQGVWAEARATEDVAAFLPTLRRVVALRQEEGQALAQGGDVYDALLDDYEPGARAAELDEMFGALRPRLVALRGAILDKPQPAALSGRFDETAQLALTRELAELFGYDFARGRIDKAVHPFCSGSGNDVRVTTRTDPADPFNCLYSTIHEVGHASYEQNVEPDYLLTPIGRGVSMGVHESQSRIYENQLARSPAFAGWLLGRMRDSFGNIGIDDPMEFARALNRVSNGYIRTEADEVQYNLHVLMRFDLERALMSGDLNVGNLEAAWNDRFAADFGFAVDKPSNGCLQDVHWSVGLMGYFPTYSLGNVYAGCLHAALRADRPELEAELARGDLSGATTWLRDKVQRHGALMSPRETIQAACGAVPSEAPLLDYLETKFGALYDL